MATPKKYFQICSIDAKGTIHPFEIHQFGEIDTFFTSEVEAEEWIKANLKDSQSPELTPIQKTDAVLIILPIFIIRYK